MTAIDLLKQFLFLQNPKAVELGDWEALEFKEKPSVIDLGTTVVIPSVKIGFSFDKEGNFEGIYNYKD